LYEILNVGAKGIILVAVRVGFLLKISKLLFSSLNNFYVTERTKLYRKQNLIESFQT